MPEALGREKKHARDNMKKKSFGSFKHMFVLTFFVLLALYWTGFDFGTYTFHWISWQRVVKKLPELFLYTLFFSGPVTLLYRIKKDRDKNDTWVCLECKQSVKVSTTPPAELKCGCGGKMDNLLNLEWEEDAVRENL